MKNGDINDIKQSFYKIIDNFDNNSSDISHHREIKLSDNSKDILMIFICCQVLSKLFNILCNKNN